MGAETGEILEEKGCENLEGSPIHLIAFDVHGVEDNDPRLAQFQEFLQQCIQHVYEGEFELVATSESLNMFIDTLESRVLNSFQLVFHWNCFLLFEEESETLLARVTLQPYDFAPIFGYTKQ